MRHSSWFIPIILFSSYIVVPAQAESLPLWGNDSLNNLYVVDIETRNATLVSQTDVLFYDIAFDSSGELYGVSGEEELYQIDPFSGATTLVGDVGTRTNSLVFGPDGTLWSAGVDALYTVDTETGAAAFAVDLAPFDSAGDLAFDNQGNLLLATLQGMLLRIDTEVGSFVTLGEIGFPNVLGLTRADNGNLFGFTSGNQLLGVDQNAGAAENLGTITALDFTPGQTYGSSFSNVVLPEPGTLLLLMAGAVGIARRKNLRP